MPFLTESVYVKTWWKLCLGIKLNAQCYLPLGIPLICGRAAGWQIDVRALPVLFPAACVGILRRIDTVGAHCHFIPRPLNSCWVTAESRVIGHLCAWVVLDLVSGDVSRPNQILQFNNMEEGWTMSTIFMKPGSPAENLALSSVKAKSLSNGGKKKKRKMVWCVLFHVLAVLCVCVCVIFTWVETIHKMYD